MAQKTSISLRVNLTEPEAPNGGSLSGFRLEVEVTSASLIDKEIFVFHRQVRGEGSDNEPDDFFYSVASLAQMHQLPAHSIETLDQPFYRDSSFAIIFETYEEAIKARDIDILPFVRILAEANDHAIDNKAQTLYEVDADGVFEDTEDEESTEESTDG